MNKKKIAVGVASALAVLGGVVAMSAWEAHVINVTATIENALSVSLDEMHFGTVFPQEKLEKDFTVSLSESFQSQAQCSEINLLENGGFEEPVVDTSQEWDIFPDGDTDLAWRVEWRSDIESEYGGYQRPDPSLQELHGGVNDWAPAEGNQYAELDTDWDGPGEPLNNEPASVKIYQDIATVPGRTYKLSFAFSPRPSTTSDNNQLEVRWDGGVVETIGPEAGISTTSWTYYDYELVATGDTTRVQFTDMGTADSLGTFLDDVSLVECGRVTSVDYVIRQKPKCWSEIDKEYGRVTEAEVQPGVFRFECVQSDTAQDYEMLPVLCPYLSKHDLDPDDENDGEIDAFHGDPSDGWSMTDVMDSQVLGKLSVVEEDIVDEWLIDLMVPCFSDYCSQDWEEFVTTINPDVVDPYSYTLPSDQEHELFGCDLWLEVTGIEGEGQVPPVDNDVAD